VALIKSISGIRGTIGGKPNENLSPLDIVRFTAAYGTWIKENQPGSKKIVVGRDGRISGEMVSNLVVSTLNGLGLDVIDLGLSTTPTVEIAVTGEKAAGGIIITASHNPKEWNALKLLNGKGEFISEQDGKWILDRVSKDAYVFAPVERLGSRVENSSYSEKHIQAVLQYPLVDRPAIQNKNFKVVVDVINSTGALFVPALLKALGVEQITVLNEEVNGRFAHNPEPLPENLSALSAEVKKTGASLGICGDPDVERFVFCL